MKIKNCKIKNYKNGYTIIETMIAISLFLVVIISGMGSLLNANFLHRKSQDMRSIMDSLSFAMEDMSRSLRTGYTYHCINNSILSPEYLSNAFSCDKGWGIAFESSPSGDTLDNTDQWVYYISEGKLWKKSVAGAYELSNFVQLTPDEIFINYSSSFSVLGAEPIPEDSQQPFVIIRLVGTITTKGVTTPFSLETAVSQRLLDS